MGKKPRNESTFGGRLGRAIDLRPPSVGPDGGVQQGVKDFARAMRLESEKEVSEGRNPIKGASLPSIYSYLNDYRPKQPSLDFVQHAANVCGVEIGWLAGSLGAQPTPEHVTAAAATSSALLKIGNVSESVLKTGEVFRVPGSDEVPEAMANAPAVMLAKIMGDANRPTQGFQPPWLAGVVDVWLRLGEKNVGENRVAMIADSILDPLESFGVDPAKMGREAFDEHVFAMTPVLFGVVRALAGQDGTE